jgi:hypothetical protein
MEVWQTAGARQERILFENGDEFVEDWATRTSLTYIAGSNELIRLDSDHFDRRQRVPPRIDAFPPLPAGNMTDELARALARARKREDGVRLLGETTVRNIAVYELRIDDFEVRLRAPVRPAGGRARTLRMSRLVYVDRERFLPVRVVELAPGDVVASITDYTQVERLPRTPDNERLLRMAPHPGADETVVGQR